MYGVMKAVVGRNGEGTSYSP